MLSSPSPASLCARPPGFLPAQGGFRAQGLRLKGFKIWCLYGLRVHDFHARVGVRIPETPYNVPHKLLIVPIGCMAVQE